MSDDNSPPVVDLDTPDQPNSWVAEVARRRGKRRHPLLLAQQAIAAATKAAKKDKQHTED